MEFKSARPIKMLIDLALNFTVNLLGKKDGLGYHSPVSYTHLTLPTIYSV